MNKKSKISTKFFYTIFVVFFSVLILSSVVVFFIMKDIKSDTQEMISEKLELKLRNKIDNSYNVGITNAVALSTNEQIISSLKEQDRDKAYEALSNVTKNYTKFTPYQRSKVHLHTKDVESFLRSWVKDHHGDPLSSFRHTINQVKATKQPVLDIEVGWADLVIRAIVPVMDGQEYMGSLEVIQDFSYIYKQLQNEKKELLFLVDAKLLKNMPKSSHIIGKYALTQTEYNENYFRILKTLDVDELIKNKHMKAEDKYFTSVPIIGFNDSLIGYYVVGQDYDEIEKIISQSSNIVYLFTGLIFLIGLITAGILNYTIKKLVLENITKVRDGLSSFFKYLNKENNQVEKIDIVANDEIGQMAKEINTNIVFTQNAMELEDRKTWIKDGIRELNRILSSSNDTVSVCNNSVSFMCEYLKAAVGAVYVLDQDNKVLHLMGSYAFIQRNDLSSEFHLGEGVVGQVALQKTPIQLTDVNRTNIEITTGTTSEKAVNTYTFPLLFKENIYGVVEIATTFVMKEHHKEFLTSSNEFIATFIFTSLQNSQVKKLLNATEKSNQELHTQKEELKEANTQMQEQQAQLEEANAQMQEQQAQLEEANAQMEEQQLQLKQSEHELIKQNKILEESKKELDEKATALEESNRYKSEFLANMSHELRTPLNSIILLSSMLQQNKVGNLQEDQIKKAKIINSSGEELLRLINDVLDLSKVEAGKLELIIDQFHSSEFISNLKDLFEPSVENKGLKLIIEDNYNDLIFNDEDKLSQVMRNFLSNALKFTHEGFVKIQIDKDPAGVKLTVQDTGIGIEEDKQDLVFQAFSQVDGGISRKYGGTGLGLSITKEFVGLMGGEIGLESKKDEGSSFSLIIPNHHQNYEASTSQKTQTKHVKPVSNSVKTSVEDDRENLESDDKPFLVIEDNKTFAYTLKEHINDNGDKVIIALEGQTGLDLASKYENIQGILLDLGLPDVDGVEVLKHLKSSAQTKSIPVYIISGQSNKKNTTTLGAIGFKQKPLSEDDFQSVFDHLKHINEKKIKDLLVVEDDEIQRDVMIDFISDENLNIHGVSNVDEAIVEIEKGIYDAIIVDLGLHGKSGMEICEYIKVNHLNVPIIVYTGKELSLQEENRIKKYTDSIIIKSANSQSRLLDEVDMFLHRAKKNSSITRENLQSSDQIDLEGKKILVVDDDMRNTFVLVEILEEKNATVLTAQNGQEALDILDENLDMDVVLMDVMMPVMDGYEAIEHIRENEKTKDIPVIAVTAKAMHQDKQKSLEVGANDYLTKPLNLETFVGVVNSWIK